jgi:hypothetical protein
MHLCTYNRVVLVSAMRRKEKRALGRTRHLLTDTTRAPDFYCWLGAPHAASA